MRNSMKLVLCSISILLAATFCWKTLVFRADSAPGQRPDNTVGTHQYKSYDYTETNETRNKSVRLTIPDGLTTVRGILVVTNPAGGDTRNWYNELWFGEFLYYHDFAFLGAQNFNSHAGSYQVMQHALLQIAKDSNHPELVNVPYVTTGFSAGAGFANRLMVEAPDRVIASVLISGTIMFGEMIPSPSHLQTPTCVISGELEVFSTQGKTDAFSAHVEPVLAAYRPKGAFYGWMVVQNAGHARNRQEVLAMPYLDACVRLRYPVDADVRKGPIKLKTIAPNSGWIADNTTWKNNMTSIVPAKEFKGDITTSTWLPTEDVAYIYRSFSTFNKTVSIVSPKTPWSNTSIPKPTEVALDPGSDVTIMVNASKYPNWKKVEFFDGATKLGEVTQNPTRFVAKGLKTGYHVFTALATDANGNPSPSNPEMVIVHK